MKRGTPTHPKTEALGELLEIPLPYAVGLVEMLFHFADQYAPRGDVGRFTDPQIARKLGWEGDPETLISALVLCGGAGRSGYLDTHGLHRLVVHDWGDHAPDYTKRKAKGTDKEDGTGWAIDDPEPEPQPAESNNETVDSRKIQTNLGESGSPSLSFPNLPKPRVAKPPRRRMRVGLG